MYQIPELLAYSNLRHAFSTVKDGNMGIFFNSVRMNKQEVISNRVTFLSSLGINIGDCSCTWLIHSDKAVIVTSSRKGKSMTDLRFLEKADAQITAEKGIFLFLLIADCIPIILYDPGKRTLALIHAGQTGVNLNIIRKTIEKMGRLTNTDPKDLVVGIGPCARNESYIHSQARFLNNPLWNNYIKRVKSGFSIDFVGLANKQLLNAGVKPQNIFDSGIDTITDNTFFSHYRDYKSGRKDRGRFACVVGLT